MNRRELLKLLTLGVVGQTLDVDKLLWVPGQKTIFLPPATGLTTSQIVALELERIVPKIRMLFERDDAFYSAIRGGENDGSRKVVTGREEFRIPLSRRRQGLLLP